MEIPITIKERYFLHEIWKKLFPFYSIYVKIKMKIEIS